MNFFLACSQVSEAKSDAVKSCFGDGRYSLSADVLKIPSVL